MMDLRKRIYIGASIVVGFLIILSIFFLYFRQTEQGEEVPEEPAVGVVEAPVIIEPTTPVIISPVMAAKKGKAKRINRTKPILFFISLNIERSI